MADDLQNLLPESPLIEAMKENRPFSEKGEFEPVKANTKEVGFISDQNIEKQFNDDKQKLADIKTGMSDLQTQLLALQEQAKAGITPEKQPTNIYHFYDAQGNPQPVEVAKNEDPLAVAKSKGLTLNAPTLSPEEREALGMEAGETTTVDPEIERLQTDVTALNSQFTDVIGQLDGLTAVDPLSQAQKDAIKKTFDVRRQQMQEINRRRQQALRTGEMRRGGLRYAPDISKDLISFEEQEGITRLAEIDALELQAIAEATEAARQEQFDVLRTKIESIDRLRDNRMQELANLQNMSLERSQELREQAKAEREQLKFELELAQIGEITPTTEYRNWELAGAEEGTGQTFGQWLETRKADQLPMSYKEWSLAGGEEGTGVSFADWLSREEAAIAAGYSQLDIDNAAMSILDRAANIFNFPKEVRGEINTRMRQIREEGYIPNWLIEKASDTQLKQISEFDTTIASWERVKELAATIREEIGPTKFGAYDNSMSNLFAQYANEQLPVLKAEVEKAFQLYRKATTGAQASDKELRMLRPLLPAIKERPEVFFRKLEETMQGTMRAKRVYLDVLEKGKVDIGAFGEEPETEEGLGKDQIEAEYEKYLKQSK